MSEVNRLAIIIVNYNNYDMTLNLVQNLKGHCVTAPVVIVDNCSTNDSYHILTNKLKDVDKVHVISTDKNLGYSGGNNYGINYICSMDSSIEYIAIMNPDTEVISDTVFQNIIHGFEKDQSLAALTTLTILNNRIEKKNSCAYKKNKYCKLLIQNLFCLKKFVNDRYNGFLCNDDLISYVYKIQGCFFVIRKDIFYQVGLFDEKVFLYFEEEILAKKIADAGLKCGVLISEWIKHNHQNKENEIKEYKARRFHNKVLLESKGYYMKNYAGIGKTCWLISYCIDSFTRKIGDLIFCIKRKITQ